MYIIYIYRERDRDRDRNIERQRETERERYRYILGTQQQMFLHHITRNSIYIISVQYLRDST